MNFELGKLYTHETFRDVLCMIHKSAVDEAGIMIEGMWFNRGFVGKPFPIYHPFKIFIKPEDINKWSLYHIQLVK